MDSLDPPSWLSSSASNACDPAFHSVPVSLAEKPLTVTSDDSEDEAVRGIWVGEDTRGNSHKGDRIVDKTVWFVEDENIVGVMDEERG